MPCDPPMLSPSAATPLTSADPPTDSQPTCIIEMAAFPDEYKAIILCLDL